MVVLELEVVRHRVVAVSEGQRKGRQVCVLLHPDGLRQHLSLEGELAERAVAVKGNVVEIMHFREHPVGIVAEPAGHIDIQVEVHAHHGLELPQGEHHAVLGVIDVRDGRRDIGLGPRKIQFGGLLGIEAHLRLLEILHGVFIDLLVHLEGFFRHQDRVEGLLDGGHRAEPGLARLLDGKFDLVAGQPQALPELGIHQRHGRVDARAVRVQAADGETAVRGTAFIRLDGSHIRRDHVSARLDDLGDIVHDRIQDPGHHAGHSAAAFLVIGPAAHVHDLLLDGPLVGPAAVDLRQQRGIGALPGVLLPLDLHVRHLDGHIFRQGDPERVFERQHDGRIRLLRRPVAVLGI